MLARSGAGLARKQPWRQAEQRAGAAFLAALDTQILLGFLLYFGLSPLTPKSFADLGTFMHVPTLRFFAVEHGVGMLVAAAAAHVGWARGKRSPDDATRQRRVLIGVGVAILAILASIPWPFLPYGRDLFRSLG